MMKNSLLTAVAGMVLFASATPAVAQKKGAGLRINPAVLTPAQAADAALTRGDATTAEPLVAQAELAAANDEERYLAAALRYRAEAAKQVATPTAAGTVARGPVVASVACRPVSRAASTSRCRSTSVGVRCGSESARTTVRT